MRGLLNESEFRRFKEIKSLAVKNLPEAKRQAVVWINANKRRKGNRAAALRAIRGMHSA